MRLWSKALTCAVALVALYIPARVGAMQVAVPAVAPKAAKSAAHVTATPSAQEIADAKAKGLVWVNMSTKVYHKDGAFYGATKRGKFMTEDEATKAGYRAAKTGGSKKAAASK